MANGNPTGCIGKACQHVIVDDYAACETGSSACTQAKLLEAEPSGFHDENLIEATRRISEVLESIPPDPRGRKLSLLHTNFGSLLAWVDHNATVPADRGVRPDADDATIAKALRLKGCTETGVGAGTA
jgi:hypothetical protein